MKIYVRKQTSPKVIFINNAPTEDWDLQQFQMQYAPGIFHFELINFHLMLCIDLELCKVIAVCTDLDIKDVENYVKNYEWRRSSIFLYG